MKSMKTSDFGSNSRLKIQYFKHGLQNTHFLIRVLKIISKLPNLKSNFWWEERKRKRLEERPAIGYSQIFQNGFSVTNIWSYLMYPYLVIFDVPMFDHVWFWCTHIWLYLMNPYLNPNIWSLFRYLKIYTFLNLIKICTLWDIIKKCTRWDSNRRPSA